MVWLLLFVSGAVVVFIVVGMIDMWLRLFVVLCLFVLMLLVLVVSLIFLLCCFVFLVSRVLFIGSWFVIRVSRF